MPQIFSLYQAQIKAEALINDVNKQSNIQYELMQTFLASNKQHILLNLIRKSTYSNPNENNRQDILYTAMISLFYDENSKTKLLFYKNYDEHHLKFAPKLISLKEYIAVRQKDAIHIIDYVIDLSNNKIILKYSDFDKTTKEKIFNIQ